jgi:hypothetical protein
MDDNASVLEKVETKTGVHKDITLTNRIVIFTSAKRKLTQVTSLLVPSILQRKQNSKLRFDGYAGSRC